VIDLLGSGPTFMLGSLLLAGSSYAFYHGIASGMSQLVPLYMLAGFAVGIVGAVPYVMVNAFPPVVRFSGLSFSYNVAYAIFGGLTPMLVTLWMANDVLAPSHYVVSLSALGFVISCWLWLQQRNRPQQAPQAA
ncbi:MAG: MFS transporter, partial [Aeromonas jandaei]